MTIRALRLPSSLLRSGFSLARLLAADSVFPQRRPRREDPNRDRSWAESYLLLEALELSGPEREFARELLRRKSNLWLYRSNQRTACGDFLVVDMAPPRPAWRRVVVLELKAGEPLRLDAGGLQLAGHEAAIEELCAAGVVDGGRPSLLARGSGEAILRDLFKLR
jgi:hypothetical protein